MNSCRHIAFRKYVKDMYISYGRGGGFTGATETHIIRGSGSLYHIKAFSTDTVFVKTANKKTLKEIFLYADSKKLKKIDWNKPGNMTGFIHFYRDERIVKSWQWSEGSDIPVELRELYNRLNKLN